MQVEKERRIKETAPAELKYLQMYQRFQAPESMWGYRCNLVIFNKSVNEKFFISNLIRSDLQYDSNPSLLLLNA